MACWHPKNGESSPVLLMETCMKKGFKTIVTVLALALAGSLLSGCHHRHSNHGDPEKMAEKLEKHLDHVLGKIDATPQQGEKIRLISAQIVADAKQIRSQGAEDHVKIVAFLLLDTPGRQWLHDQVDKKTTEMNEFAHRTVDRLIEISAVLTPEQRAGLKKRFESSHGKKG